MIAKKTWSYQDAGVSIDKADQVVSAVSRIAKTTHRPGVLSDIGGFGALFEVPIDRYRRPVLVSGTDGVGTKLKLAIEMNQHDTIGIDLVAMCVNDILTLGAEPLFFLDYFATGALNPAQAACILEGIAEGCRQAGAALIGGETAEMPGMYQGEDYDLAGFAVGVVEKKGIIDGSRIEAGDQLIAIGSSGPHSNGYSLIRKIVAEGGHVWGQAFDDTTLGEALLRPTRIYVSTILKLLADGVPIRGMVHVTGGGLVENMPRILPVALNACVELSSWKRPAIFEWLQQEGGVSEGEMFRTFNMGVGMVLVVPEEAVLDTVLKLKGLGECAWHLGSLDVSMRVPGRLVLRD